MPLLKGDNDTQRHAKQLYYAAKNTDAPLCSASLQLSYLLYTSGCLPIVLQVYTRFFLRCFRDPIRVRIRGIENRAPRIRRNDHRVPKVRNQVPTGAYWVPNIILKKNLFTLYSI